VFAGRDDEDAWDAAVLASAVGLRNVAGYLAGGMTSWREERQPVERVERITVTDLHRSWEADPHAVQVLDVRERTEWDAGHIPESFHRPYHDLRELPDELDSSRPIAAICGAGPRAAVAASLLKRLGAEHVIHVVDGGTSRWRQEGWPIER
jgi:hydroxyacylglutathione hydrolase